MTELPDLRLLVNLELVRLSDNRLTERTIVDSGIFSLPLLSWVALGGQSPATALSDCVAPQMILDASQLQLGHLLGKGASGQVFQGTLPSGACAVKGVLSFMTFILPCAFV